MNDIIMEKTDTMVAPHDIVENIFSLRSNFIIIGLTGRTGSGCTTVADILAEANFDSLKTKYKLRHEGPIDNNARKRRIVYDFISNNWVPYTIIKASDIIYFFAFQLEFSEIIDAIAAEWNKIDGALKQTSHANKANYLDTINDLLDSIKDEYSAISLEVRDLKDYLEKKSYKNETNFNILDNYIKLILQKVPRLRNQIESKLSEKYRGKIPELLQNWGDNIRQYKSVIPGTAMKDGPEAIAAMINLIIKLLRQRNRLYSDKEKAPQPTRIVIDALRNPFEILYFRERWSSFYCLSVNTPKDVRHDKLMKYRNLTFDEVIKIDKREEAKKQVRDSFQKIDIDRCLQLADVHLSHNGMNVYDNYELINQLFTYLSLMLHPGLVPPSPEERLMQIAYTAKLNSGCLSRQVGAAITDSNYSLKAIGWNSTPAGQVPCALRQLGDLIEHMDLDAFSHHEQINKDFRTAMGALHLAYNRFCSTSNLKGIPLRYCFKDIHTTIAYKQTYNQVHTRSLHAEENAFLQIAKYGGEGIEGGKLFTTASCCEPCAKKAYHLGIKEIYYIDSYPGITLEHILMGGASGKGPQLKLFSGAVGRAYINLYNPLMPFKDELEALTDVEVKSTVEPNRSSSNDRQNIKNQKSKSDGSNSSDK